MPVSTQLAASPADVAAMVRRNGPFPYLTSQQTLSQVRHMQDLLESKEMEELIGAIDDAKRRNEVMQKARENSIKRMQSIYTEQELKLVVEKELKKQQPQQQQHEHIMEQKSDPDNSAFNLHNDGRNTFNDVPSITAQQLQVLLSRQQDQVDQQSQRTLLQLREWKQQHNAYQNHINPPSAQLQVHSISIHSMKSHNSFNDPVDTNATDSAVVGIDRSKISGRGHLQSLSGLAHQHANAPITMTNNESMNANANNLNTKMLLNNDVSANANTANKSNSNSVRVDVSSHLHDLKRIRQANSFVMTAQKAQDMHNQYKQPYSYTSGRTSDNQVSMSSSSSSSRSSSSSSSVSSSSLSSVSSSSNSVSSSSFHAIRPSTTSGKSSKS
jgi:hypothetical protein